MPTVLGLQVCVVYIARCISDIVGVRIAGRNGDDRSFSLIYRTRLQTQCDTWLGRAAETIKLSALLTRF